MLGKMAKLICLSLKFESLEKENNSLENQTNSKQGLVDSVVEYNSDLLRHQCFHFKQNLEIVQGNHKVSSDDKNGAKNNFRNSFSKYKRNVENSANLGNIYQRVKRFPEPPNQPATGSSSSLPKKEIPVIGDSMIKHVNG